MTRHLPHPFANRCNALICSVLLYDRIIAVSEFIGGVLRQSGVPPTRVNTVANGIEHSPVDSRARYRLREALGIPDDALLLAAAGRVSAEKGFEQLVKAVSMLHSSGLRPYCAIFGSGPELENLRSTAAGLGLDVWVRLPGFRSDVAELFAAADVAVVPSIWPEPFGYVALEALSAGCAVVASAAGALPEVFGDHAALLTAPGDVEALATGIRELLLDPDRRRQMGQAARARAGVFSLDACASGLEHVYSSLVSPAST